MSVCICADAFVGIADALPLRSVGGLFFFFVVLNKKNKNKDFVKRRMETVPPYKGRAKSFPFLQLPYCGGNVQGICRLFVIIERLQHVLLVYSCAYHTTRLVTSSGKDK